MEGLDHLLELASPLNGCLQLCVIRLQQLELEPIEKTLVVFIELETLLIFVVHELDNFLVVLPYQVVGDVGKVL